MDEGMLIQTMTKTFKTRMDQRDFYEKIFTNFLLPDSDNRLAIQKKLTNRFATMNNRQMQRSVT